jgi:hypothetical protein
MVFRPKIVADKNETGYALFFATQKRRAGETYRGERVFEVKNL